MTSVTSVTVRVPLTIRRRGGRKMIISPDGVAMTAGHGTPADIAITRGDPALVKALARAFRWRRMLETGAACSVSDIARQEKLNTSYVSRVLRLTLLAPDIVEAVLDGRQAPEMTLQALLKPLPDRWDQQRGVTGVPGAYFLGLSHMYKTKSSFLSGVGEDAAYLGEHIAGRNVPPP
ncbi:MAG: hypothetical protein AB7O80_09310 [Acetobacteraceae bacterium]